MLSCPKCQGTQINETTRQVRVVRPEVKQAVRRALKYVFLGLILVTAIIAAIVTSVAPSSSDTIRNYLTFGGGAVLFVGLLTVYAKNRVMRTMNIYTCAACRKTWCQIAEGNS